MPRDQRPDDSFSLVFDSGRLHERLEILGAPVVRLSLRCAQPQANLVVRLCEVAPDGSSLRVTYGILNLAHRDGHGEPRPLDPERTYQVAVTLNDIAHAFPVGHRIRVSVSSAYWPVIWPSPETAVLRILTGRGELELPVRSPRDEDRDLPPFEPPEMAKAPGLKRIRHHAFRRRLEVDLTSNDYHYELNGSEFDDASLVHLEDIDLHVGYTINKWFDIGESDPLSAREIIQQRATLRRGEWKITVTLVMTLTGDREAFHLVGELTAAEGTEGSPFLSREFSARVPRRLV